MMHQQRMATDVSNNSTTYLCGRMCGVLGPWPCLHGLAAAVSMGARGSVLSLNAYVCTCGMCVYVSLCIRVCRHLLNTDSVDMPSCSRPNLDPARIAMRNASNPELPLFGFCFC